MFAIFIICSFTRFLCGNLFSCQRTSGLEICGTFGTLDADFAEIDIYTAAGRKRITQDYKTLVDEDPEFSSIVKHFCGRGDVFVSTFRFDFAPTPFFSPSDIHEIYVAVSF